MGVTLGFHRLLTHRSFATYKPVQYALAIIGSMAVQGPVMNWVADHRKHHAHTDQEGDPHTPHGHGSGVKGAITGLWYAHMGWLFEHSGTTEHERYARDLYEDRGMQVDPQDLPGSGSRSGSRSRPPPASLVTGTWRGAFEAALWGGAVRIFLAHHMTWSINSVCHFFGTRRFDVEDHSTNVFWLAPFSMGESWHHNHHTFPRSRLPRPQELGDRPDGLGDPRRCGASKLAWNVVEITPERQREKLA